MTCKWTQDSDGDYITSCGEEICSMGDTLKETGWVFCFYCGLIIEEVKT